MLSLRKPSPERIRHLLAEQAALNFTYAEVGATAATTPAGYDVDYTHVPLGTGEQAFLAARAALERWDQFRLGWVAQWPPDAPIAAGETVAIMGKAVGLWWLNACRIVYVIEEEGPLTRFGFAYGTLPGHVERGEERFTVQWNRDDDMVAYEILAFSHPQHILARMGYPVVRRKQKRFARESGVAMQRAVLSHDLSG